MSAAFCALTSLSLSPRSCCGQGVDTAAAVRGQALGPGDLAATPEGQAVLDVAASALSGGQPATAAGGDASAEPQALKPAAAVRLEPMVLPPPGIGGHVPPAEPPPPSQSMGWAEPTKLPLPQRLCGCLPPLPRGGVACGPSDVAAAEVGSITCGERGQLELDVACELEHGRIACVPSAPGCAEHGQADVGAAGNLCAASNEWGHPFQCQTGCCGSRRCCCSCGCCSFCSLVAATGSQGSWKGFIGGEAAAASEL
mmetsp:Transcript_22623/g.63059  ORF Transcript_22623/g.63059 Transcript_22623/m.63059 type:complete len:255 (-) Transcript_22623:107-871(-)